ncbi:MAG: phytoene/squalene synthase family protein [bacterium]
MKPITKKDLAQIEGCETANIIESNFALSFMFLPKDKCSAITSIYTLCSYIDDIVDSSDNLFLLEVEQKEKRMKFWQDTILDIYYGNPVSPLLEPLAWTIRKYNIPISKIEVLFDGISKDLRKRDYDTIEDMLDYCYGVAGIVGLICLNIFGDTSDSASKYAVSLGYALQITNIMRDVRDDAQRSYRYIPEELLTKYHYNATDVTPKTYNTRFIAVMKELGGLAESYYIKADSYLALLPKKRLMLASEIMKNTYHTILDEIINNNYNVLTNKKIKLSKFKKIGIALKTIVKLK